MRSWFWGRISRPENGGSGAFGRISRPENRPVGGVREGLGTRNLAGWGPSGGLETQKPAGGGPSGGSRGPKTGGLGAFARVSRSEVPGRSASGRCLETTCLARTGSPGGLRHVRALRPPRLVEERWIGGPGVDLLGVLSAAMGSRTVREAAPKAAPEAAHQGVKAATLWEQRIREAPGAMVARLASGGPRAAKAVGRCSK